MLCYKPQLWCLFAFRHPELLCSYYDRIWTERVLQRLCRINIQREVISAWKTSHQHNNTDPNRLPLLSPGIRVNARYINSSLRTYLLWSLCTLYFTRIWGCTSGGVYVPCILLAFEDVLLVEFMYLVFYSHLRMYFWWSLCTLYFTRVWGCTSVDVLPCIYSHLRMYFWRSLCPLYFTRFWG